MDTFHDHIFNLQNDREDVTALLMDYRRAGHVTHEPHLWRFVLLMTSRLWNPTDDARLWFDETGNLAAFAMLNRRNPDAALSSLEWVIRPDMVSVEQIHLSLLAIILTWASKRLQQIVTDQQQNVTVSIFVAEDAPASLIALLRSFQFVLYEQGYNVYMARHIAVERVMTRAVKGFVIRSLEITELDRYDALFGFTAVNREHRCEQFASSEYYHFVAVAENGNMVGYCECSINRQEWAHNNLHTGWLDYIGVEDAYLRHGLGSALTETAIQQLQRWGADTVQLITASSNEAAQQLYRNCGFDLVLKEYAYNRNF